MAIALDTARYSNTKPGSGCNRLSRRLRSASSFVVNCAVFAPCCALLDGGGSFSVLYSASATCCGDPRFTRAPSGMDAAAADSIPASLRRKSPTAARTADGSKPKPTCSICPSAAATLPSVRTTFGSSPAVARRRCASEADARISARKPPRTSSFVSSPAPARSNAFVVSPRFEPSPGWWSRDDTAAIPPSCASSGAASHAMHRVSITSNACGSTRAPASASARVTACA